MTNTMNGRSSLRVFLPPKLLDEFYDETEAAEKRAALDTLLANPFVEHQPAI